MKHATKYKERLLEHSKESKTKKHNGIPCREWTKVKNKFGYGQIWTCVEHNIRGWFAHRLSYTLNIGRIPKGYCVLHKCDNPACITPEHLYIGTRRQNNMDKIQKKRHSRGDKHGNAKLSREDVDRIRELVGNGTHTRTQLAKEYGVSQQQVSAVVNKIYWKDEQ